MAIDPNELSTKTLEALTDLAEESGKNGKDLTTALREAADALKSRPSPEEDWIDTEYLQWCEEELKGKEIPSLDEVRQALSSIPGSLSDEIVAERDEG